MSELELTVVGETDAYRTDRLVRSLHEDLRRLGRVTVARRPADAPANAMSGAGTDVATLVVSGVFSAATLKAISDVVTGFLDRSKAREVQWERDGVKGHFVGLSARDQHALVTAFLGQAAGDGEAVNNGDDGASDSTADRD